MRGLGSLPGRKRMSDSETRRVLVVFANPRGTDALRLGEEDRALTESIRLSKHRDHVVLTKCHAATVHDLSRALLDDDYDFVHISGHGTRTGLVLEKEDGSRYVVPQSGLADLFAAYVPPQGKLRCVVLNACYSVSTGTLASLGVPATIAMEGPISDTAAIEFSRGFYDALGAGKDVRFAYDEGCRRVKLSAPGARFVAKFLGPDDADAEELVQDAEGQARGDASVPPVLLGLAVDLSGSMQGSIRNRSNRTMSRLDGFREALDNAVRDARQSASTRDEEADSCHVFAYGFGLRHRSVECADLFSLVSASKDLITDEELDRIKTKHTNEVRRRYEARASQYGGVADLARRYLGGGVVGGFERSFRAQAEAEVRDLVVSEVSDRLARRLEELGETTLSLGEVSDLWKESESAFEGASELIFGLTPMRSALGAVRSRFEAELQRRPEETLASLFLLSDGDPTDGDPREVVEEIRSLGVLVVSCSVTDRDVADPRTLYGEPLASWSDGARLMFDAASAIDDGSEFADFLLRRGWSIQPGARLFVQLNHTDVLEELMDVMVLRARRERFDWQLPAGEDARSL